MMKLISYRRIRYALLLGVMSLGLLSCGEPVGGTGKSPVFLIAEGGTKWGTIVDVYKPGVLGNVEDDYYNVTIRSVYKGNNPDIRTTYATVIIYQYTVTYYRVDGNPEVPEPFTIQMMSQISPGGSINLNLLILRRDAKLQSPLKELVFGGGEGYIEFNAVLEFFGEDLLGNHLSTKFVLSINATDM